ncbi:unnamed protein product [Gongylonema pulchrum]|uniref:Protein UBASH3A-like protein n=1 Tax=Gongylonema pulchrum TaxID=637853 RepID=A0A183EEE4_9BILA|nr:unnamed protein product [Gongylonema pulchrum]
MKEAFGVGKHYCRFDPEMPKEIPSRDSGVDGYAGDPPLTNRGFRMAINAGVMLLTESAFPLLPFLFCSLLKYQEYQDFLTSFVSGVLLKERNITVDFLYVSPALRCIQTAQGILKGLGNSELELLVEPGLFQWMRWCKNRMPEFLSINELVKADFPVSTTYKPLYNAQNYDLHETLEEYFQRSYALIKNILARHSEGTILCVAHAGSLSTLSQQLCGKEPLIADDFSRFLRGISYLSCEEVQEQDNRSWESAGSPIPKLSTSGLDRC